MPPVLLVKNAEKSFGQTAALRGVDLELRRGELLALLGPNGAGKTTLMRAIVGTVRLDRGTVEQRPPDDAAAAQSPQLGFVPQELAIYPLLTARENLRAFGAFYGVRGGQLEQRVKWALEWTGLAERADQAAQQFSGGMKRRLNIACGVLHEPATVLLDEPTVGVDPQSRERIWEMCRQLQAQGASLILTTHQLDEAQRICDRIVIIDHGRVIATGTLSELISQTVGPQRRVTLRLRAPIQSDGLACEWSEDRRSLSARVSEVADELPLLLERVRGAGGEVDDVQVERPSLQAVFIHLTGQALRE